MDNQEKMATVLSIISSLNYEMYLKIVDENLYDHSLFLYPLMFLPRDIVYIFAILKQKYGIDDEKCTNVFSKTISVNTIAQCIK